MHILFLYNSPINPYKGGVQRVTFVLANYFRNKGIYVSFLSVKPRDFEFEDTENFTYYNLPNSSNILDTENISFFRDILQKKNVDVVINQGATNPEISILSFETKQMNKILISVIHNSLFSKIENAYFTYENRLKNKYLGFLIILLRLSFIKDFLKKIYILKYGKHFKGLYRQSDKIILLSDVYKSEYDLFVKDRNNKVIGIPNPLSFSQFESNIEIKKESRILYVGRLDFEQKRVDVLLNIWKAIQKEFPSWRLTIVGDGLVKKEIESRILKENIESIDLLGFCDPRPYYAYSSILCLTSSYEGFPMVLTEGMFFGTVPIGFNSYGAIRDIIDDEENGVLVKPFDKEEYIRKLKNLMEKEENLQKMSIQAKIKVLDFSIDIVGDKWISLLAQIKNNSNQS